MKMTFFQGMSRTTKFAFWISTVLFVVVLLNLIYGFLLHEPKLAGIVPAASTQLKSTLISEGQNVEELIATLSNHIEDIDRYMANIKERGNIFHSTTLGVFVVDRGMADYIFSHQQYSDKSLAVSASEKSENLLVSNVIKYDINNANEMFKQALLSRNPTRWKKMVEAKLILKEIECMLNERVGERVYGKSLTYKFLTDTQK